MKGTKTTYMKINQNTKQPKTYNLIKLQRNGRGGEKKGNVKQNVWKNVSSEDNQAKLLLDEEIDKHQRKWKKYKT